MPERANHLTSDPKPEPPREPEPGECCQSGCEPCIYDHYWEALERYERTLREWARRQAETPIR
ncbi:MAG TPA: oxidoreductase-like domain-containing protein [Burkholderiales bacterium]|nr:oxidoreductase-like domain-containing protein [Burkholderiales bacterium]